MDMQLPVPNPDVICRTVEGGAVLLSTEQEVYYGLNTVGAYIWEHLPPVFQTLEELSASLRIVYPGASAEVLRADAREMLDELLANGLVRPSVGTETCDDSTARCSES